MPLSEETTSTTNYDQPEFDVENVNDETDIKSNNDDELDKGSPEELDSNDNENEIKGDIDDVEVKTSAEVPVMPVV